VEPGETEEKKPLEDEDHEQPVEATPFTTAQSTALAICGWNAKSGFDTLIRIKPRGYGEHKR
jgi:hypothetical protein